MEEAPYKKHLLQEGSTIRKALERLDFLAKDAILFIVDEQQNLIGSLTDGDVRRGLLNGFTIDSLVDEIIQLSPRFIQKGENDIQKVIEYRDNNFRIIPILDKKKKIVNVVNFRELRSYLPIDAVIMAGGRGERLRPLTDTTPKSLLKVGDKSIIEHNLDRLRLYGIDDYWISIKYLGEQIEAHIGDGNDRNVNIQYVKENNPLGTIGAVSLINNFQHDYILITNSDLLTNLDYEHFFLDFLKSTADFSVVTIPYSVNVPYAVLETSNGHVVDFKEKPTYTYYSNAGIYLMKKEILEFVPHNLFYNATDLMEELIRNKKKVISYPMQGYWLDIGRLEDYEKARIDFTRIKFD
ncbi:MAG: nucleotidyltransferase family protein [Bacteroidetes bacterium]|nr:nucleotidyltransferase family protein [Bacteroidota bacterium]MBU1580965.1 nucleotidyltransferase family protein [Bacteroidota bacterium]